MSEISKTRGPLTDEDLVKVEAVKTAVRARFAQFADDDDVGEVLGPVDPDNPPLTDAQLARLRSAAEVVPALVTARLGRKMGRFKVAAPKIEVSIRLDPDVIEMLKSSGEDWQSWTNGILRNALGLSERQNTSDELRDAADDVIQVVEDRLNVGRRGKVRIVGSVLTREVSEEITLHTETVMDRLPVNRHVPAFAAEPFEERLTEIKDDR